MVALTYGSLNLTASPYALEFGLDTGAPQNVYEAFAFLLQDGEIELSNRASNRSLQFNVLIEGANLGALDDYEAALILETEKPMNTITIDPGDSGVASVYETFRGQVTLARDDAWEMARMRRYTVTVRAFPFVRSAAEVTTAALPASGTTTTLVDNGSATTNWTGTTNGGAATVAVVSGAVGVTTSALAGLVTISLTRTASITTSSTKYLVVDWKPANPGQNATIAGYGDGISLLKIGEGPSPTSGFTRTTFYVAAASIAALRLDSVTDGSQNGMYGTVVRSLHIDNINRSDIAPLTGTARQLQRTIDVAGSARTQGALAIEHSTSALGDALVYVWPEDSAPPSYEPALSPYMTGRTADTSLVSGGRNTITSASGGGDIPLGALASGSHLFMVRLSAASSVTATVTATITTPVNGVALGPTYTVVRSLALTTAYQIFALDVVQLPLSDVDPTTTNSVCRVVISATAGAAVSLDEAWLFNTSIGQFTWVDCGTGTAASGGPARRLWLEPATPLRPRPIVRIGHATDRSDSFTPDGSLLKAWQHPLFKPSRVRIRTVTTNALEAGVTLRHYPRWHTNAAS